MKKQKPALTQPPAAESNNVPPKDQEKEQAADTAKAQTSAARPGQDEKKPETPPTVGEASAPASPSSSGASASSASSAETSRSASSAGSSPSDAFAAGGAGKSAAPSDTDKEADKPAVTSNAGKDKMEKPAATSNFGKDRTSQAADGEEAASTKGKGAAPSSAAPFSGKGKGDGGNGGAGVPPPPSGPPGRRERSNALPLTVSVVALIAVGFLGWQVYELREANKETGQEVAQHLSEVDSRVGEVRALTSRNEGTIAAIKETRQEVAQRLSEGDSWVGEVRALTSRNEDAIAAIQQRFGALESKVETTEGQAAALESLYQEFSRTRSDRVLAEVEQAVNIAAQQLQLAGNFESALIALQGAEARLALPEYSHFRNLRRALLNDIDAIQAHPQVDVSGMALRMENVLQRIDGLPLAYEWELPESSSAVDMEAAEASLVDEERDGPLWRSLDVARAFATDVWHELRTMVRLERMDASGPALLAPDQSAYLRENVKIRLLTARLALLARDNRTYQEDLEQAHDWIERYFDADEDEVQRVLSDLEALAETEIRVDPPDLTETFSALRMARSNVPESGDEESSDADANAGNDEDSR